MDADDGEPALAANAFIAACILGDELSELKLPNCDNEFNAFNVAAVALFAAADELCAVKLLLLLFERGDSFGKLVWWLDDVGVIDDDVFEWWFGSADAAANAAIDNDVDDDECLLFDWLDRFDDEDGVVL